MQFEKGKALFNKVMKHGIAKCKLEKQDKDNAKVKQNLPVPENF